MEVREINNKEVWEGFLKECNEKTFLQSWNWGEFQKLGGDKIWRFGIYDNDQLVGTALVVKIKARRGTFLFLPHGPNIINSKFQIINTLLIKIKELAKSEKASFIRIAPICQRNEENVKIFKELGFRDAPIHMHPEVTWELDITPSEEELLMGMRKTTRYLIRQAQKNTDIEIVRSQSIDGLRKFNEIYYTTAKRHHFIPFSLRYLENEFSSFKDDSQISIFLGRYKDKIVSSAVIIYWENIGFYHQGASLLEYNKIPVSYLLQWEAIKGAKKIGCKLYNFWGIVDKNSKLRKHPWTGLTLFKMGFGGYKKEYVRTQDLPLSKKYYLTYLFEKLRKMKRGL